MTGLPDGVTVEIEFTASVWTDVTAYVAAEAKVSARFGRSTEFDDVGPATCTLTLRNDDGRFTPDSAGSPYYPDVIEGRRLRVTVIQSDTVGFTGLVGARASEPDTLWPGLPTDPTVDGVYPLFTGSILSWEPNYAGGMLSMGTVTVTANDALATLALHTFDDRWTEEIRALARAAATWVDVWVPKGDATTTAWNNLGVSTGADYGTATLVEAEGKVGEVAYGTPASLTIGASAEFKPSGEIGKVLDLTPAASPAAVSFWLQIPTGTLPTTTDYVLRPLAGASNLFTVRLRDDAGSCALAVYTAGGAFLGTLASNVADAAWRLISVTASGSSTVVTSTPASGIATSVTVTATDFTTCTRLIMAGNSDDGSATLCGAMLVAGISAAGDATVAPSYLRALPGQTYSHTALYSSFQTYVPEVTTWATTGGEVRTIGEPTWSGQTALAVLQTIARTINGVAYVDGSGDVTLAAADIVRPGVSAATLDIEEDLDAASAMPQFRRAADSRPTRVTITYAGGSTTLIDTAAEANLQPRREVKLDTCASDTTGAVFAGSYLLQAANGLRITQVAVDLTTSLADLWAVFLALYPTQKVTISGFDAALIGATTKVVFVQGWKVDIDHQSLVYTLDCSPGSEFTTASWDAGDEYGRWSAGTSMTVTSGTAIGTASNGTLVITTTGTSVALTTDPAMYPLYLDWDDEIVLISSPPSGSASPQTVTTTGRGQFGTAARTNHIAGESCDLMTAAVFGF